MLLLQYTIVSIFFLLELSMLAAYSYWGFYLDKGIFIKLLSGIGVPLFAAIIWGMFISPKAAVPVSTPIRITLQLILFGFAAIALQYSGKELLAIIFSIVAIIEMILMYTLKL